jgi:NADPH-dependent glutamate synthase beta subunit-like oxidoreductase
MAPKATNPHPYLRSPHDYTSEEYLALCKAWPHHQQHARKRIAIIGAGMAGLVCAWLLKKAGHSVDVFEAKKTVGGRVRTLRERFSSGFYAEAG